MEKKFMKIVSYNINACTQDKVDFLLSLEADVYVVPEIANNITISPYEYTMEYLGDISSKGLGLIWKKGKLNIPDWFKDDYKKLSYAISSSSICLKRYHILFFIISKLYLFTISP